MNFKNIAILEGDDDLRKSFVTALEGEGYRVASYQTVKAFNQAVKKSQYPLYILDAALPDGNGLEVCNQLKADSQMSNVIVLSTHPRVDEIKNGCQADIFVSKPVDLDYLIKTTKKLTASLPFD